MEPWKIILVLMPTLVWWPCEGNDKFLCDSQIINIFQNDTPISGTRSGAFSSFVCALLCKMSKNPCMAFQYTQVHHCYLYMNGTPPIQPSDRLTCQLADYVPVPSQAASTTVSPLVNITQRSLEVSTTASGSKTVLIKNVNYANFSCYPQKLFDGTSYDPKITMVNGRVADCRCEGGLYLESGTYVNETANTVADCFAACETIPSPPCKALSFMEANNTCIIATTSNNGDNSFKGVLQCYS